MAGTISYETVTETWQRMAETPVEDAQKIIDQMEKEQPIVLVYLLALDEYPFDQAEREVIFYIGTVIWEIMKQSERPLRQVTEKDIEKAEEANYKFLELLSGDTEADFMSATRMLIENYGEPEVLRYLVEALMEDMDLEFEDFLLEGDELDDEVVYLDGNGNGNQEDEAEMLDEIEVEILEVTGQDTLDALEDEDEDEDDDDEYLDYTLRDENRGMAFVLLKTVLDALIESRE